MADDGILKTGNFLSQVQITVH